MADAQTGRAVAGAVAGYYGGAGVASGGSGGAGGFYNADGGNQGPLYGGEASSATHGTVLDGSNWSVNFGGTQIATPTSSNYTPEGLPNGTSSGAAMASPLQAGGSTVLYLALGLVALGLVVRASRRGRK